MKQVTEKYYAGVYWPGRREPVDAYARRAETLFKDLGGIDPALARWFEQASSREASLKSRVPPDAATLRELFGRKKYQPGTGELDFWAWNGEATDNAVINFTCGSPSPRTPDLCVLTPPAKGPAADRLLSAPVLTQALRTMALAWEPDWGIATSTAHRKTVSEHADPGTFVGWVMYFSARRGQLPPLPPPVRVEAMDGKGSLIVLTPARFTVENPEHVALAARVHQLLEQAGLLVPLTA